MKPKRILSSLLLGLLIIGCAGKPARTDFAIDMDFSTLKSFTLSPSNEVNDKLANERAFKQVENNLLDKGFKLSADNPDFVIKVRTENNTKLRSSNVSIGLGTSTSIGSSARLGANVHKPVTAKEVEIQTIDVQIFTLENRLIWRGTDSFSLSKKPDTNIQRSEKTIMKILESFPPSSPPSKA